MIGKGEKSITNSQGDYLDIETTALTLILLMEVDLSKYSSQLEKGITFLIKNFKSGRFGSTQGTILSLKVFDKYFDSMEGGEGQKFDVEITIDQNVYEVAHFDKSLSSEVQCFKYQAKLGGLLKESAVVETTLKTLDTGSSLISLEVSFYQSDPQNESNAIDLQVKRTVDHSLVHYQIELVNQQNEKQGMTLIEVNLPSCVQIDLNQLEDLKRGNYVDYYELRNWNSQLVFYLRGMQ